MATATVIRTLDVVEAERQSLSIQRGKKEAEGERLQNRLLRIDDREREHEVKLAAGDSSVEAALDELDKERKRIGHVLKNLRREISDFDSQIATRISEEQVLRAAAAEEERRKEFEAACANLEARKAVLDSLCEDLSLRLAEFQLDCENHRQRFKEEGGQAYVAKLIEGMWKQFYRLNTIKKWKEPSTQYAGLFFEIHGLLPPQHKRAPRDAPQNSTGRPQVY